MRNPCSKTTQVAVLGAGNLGRAMIDGWLRAGMSPEQLRALVLPTQLGHSGLQAGVLETDQAETALQGADLIVLAVKPQDCETLCAQLAAWLNDRSTPVLSLCAGLRIATLQSWLGGYPHLLRAMPNLGVAAGEGANALFAHREQRAQHQPLLDMLIRPLGPTLWLEAEADLDTVTALSGSGPAYFLLLLHCLREAGQRHGLTPEVAEQLARQTLRSSAAMLGPDGDPSQLIEQVASRGGSTRKALDALTAAGFGTAIVEAVGAAARRCEELDRQLGEQGQASSDPQVMKA